MADDKKDDAENGEGKKSSKLKLILFIVLGLVIVGGGGAGAAFYFLSDDSSQEEAVAQAEEPGSKVAIYTKVRTKEGKPMFVVTLQPEGDERPHYMQAYVELKSRDQVVADTLTLHMPLVVSRVNNLFATQRFSELKSVEGKSLLRARATELVQEIMLEKLGKPGVETVLFTNFVMQ